MARFLTVGAAQMGPVGRNESRAGVVLRLLEMMREAKGRGCDLVVFTECALTPFFPRWWEEDLNACDQWFEREMPGPETQLLFEEAKKLGIGFHLGYAELAEEAGRFQHYNTSILVGPNGQVVGKYRKIHLPGQTKPDGENPHRCYEKRYFDVGNLGFRAWRAFGGTIGMCLGNDRRWPETFRVLGLQGAEMILLGYNTAATHPDYPELDHLTNFHSTLSMQAGAYQNGCYVIGVAKAGHEEGLDQIGRSAIISPSGEVVTQCTTLGDELVVHRCNLDQTRLYKDHIFDFAAHRQIEAYSLITQTRGSVPPREPEASEEEPVFPLEAGPATSISKLFTEEYGYSPEQAQELATRAERAQGLAEGAPEEKAAPTVPTPAQPGDAKKPHRERAADPLQAIREVLEEDYHYPAEKIEPILAQAARAWELVQSREAEAESPAIKVPKPKPKEKSAASQILAKARAEIPPPKPKAEPETKEILPSALPIADDVGWLPGRFSKKAEDSPERAAAVVERLMRDYRYPEATAQKIAGFAETAWNRLHETDEPTKDEPVPAEPPPPLVSESEKHQELETPPGKESKPLTTYITESPAPQTMPALSGEEALKVFTLFTEKYGYNARSARGIAERASSAWKRWKNNQASALEAVKPSPEELPNPSLIPSATAPQEPPEAAAPHAAEQPVPTAPEPGERAFVVVPCPECEFQLKINQENFGLLGRKARCPNCQTKFRLPESV